MKYLTAFLILMHVGSTMVQTAHADLDQHQQKGLEDTKALLKNAQDRNAFIKTDKKAQEVDQKVDALTGGGANKEEVYGISSDVMDKLTHESNGDPEKMQAILQEASKNPEAFYNKYFDDGAKARVRGVAGKIDAQKTTVGAPK